MTVKVDWWLGELNIHGYCSDLIDGPHSNREGVEQAAYLLENLGFKKDREFVCVKLETTPIEAVAHDVNEEALEDCKNMMKAADKLTS